MNNKDKDFTSGFYIVESNDDGFEDIYSSTSGAEESIDLSSFSKDYAKKSYSKKSHNFWGNLKNWWKQRKAWQKSAIVTAISMVLILTIAFSVIFSMFDYNYNKITEDHEELGIENVIDKDIVNVALFGIDTRNLNSFKGNADSIMILSLNTVTKKVKIVSVVRDTFVPMTYNGITTYNKINSSYQKGGPELAIKTLNTIFGLDIAEYATVNFYGMVDIIEAVGGIEAELTQAEVASAKKSKAINFCVEEICANLGVKASDHYITKPGVHHLNGIQAVAYSRIRYVANIWGTNNDYGRTDRQRYVMEQLFNKALTLEKSQYIKLAKSLIPCSETSLSYSEIIGLAFDILLKSPTFAQERMPREEFLMTSPSTSAGSVVYYDLEYAKKIIHAFFYDDITFDDYIEQNGIEKNNWYKGVNRRPSSNNTSSDNKPDSSDDKPVTSSKPSSSGEEDTSSELTGSQDDTSSSDSSGTESEDEDTDSSDTESDENSEPSTDTGASEPDDSKPEESSSDDSSSTEEE